jgi:superfamily II DNA or RNA helicase
MSALEMETGEWSVRPYQSEALSALTEALHTYDRVVLALPTGSGKTYVAAKWICDHLLRQHKKVIWIAHRIELLDQAYITFVKLLPAERIHDITWWVGGRAKNHHGKLVLVSIMAARDFPPVDADLVVIDEAHHEPAQSYRRFQQTITCSKHLGLTATPKRLDARPLGYDAIAYQKTFMSLVSEGWLARPKPVIPQTRLTFELDVRMDDFSEESLASLDTDTRNTFIANHWAQWRHKYGKTLPFAINKDHARHLYERFAALSPSPRIRYTVSGEGSRADRERAIQQFRHGDLDVLINCKIFTEGFDCPDVNTIFITRPTLSATLYMQMVGRGTRVTPTKKSFYIVDFEDNLGKFQQQLIGSWYLEEKPYTASLPSVEEYEQEASEAIDMKYFPEWFKKDIELKPIDLSLIAGYVIYQLESGREDGFLIHVEDEEEFLDIWAGMKKLVHDENMVENIVNITLHLVRQKNFQRLSLQGMLSASIALTRNTARYVSLRKPTIPDEVLAFLEGIAFDKDALTDQIHDIYALIKFTEDEISEEVVYDTIFESEARAFHEAQRRLEATKHFKGFQLRQSLEEIYQTCLVDTSIDAYTWERFAIRTLKDPHDCLLLLSDCGS